MIAIRSRNAQRKGQVMAGALRLCFRSLLITLTAAAFQSGGSGAAAAATTLDRIRADQTIRIAYREDAPPFSYKGPGSTGPSGFMVELCRVVAKKLADQLGVPSLKVAYVPVSATNRFDAIERGDADLLCEPTSATLSRRQHVDFSIATFVDGASLLTRDTSLHNMKSMAGQKIGVLSGTTTEEQLRGSLRAQGISAEIVPAATHENGLAMIDSGEIVAYFADQTILVYLLNQSKDPEKLAIAENYLSVEPYALALPRGDVEFRLAVDTALSHIYRGGEIGVIFAQAFGGNARPTETLKTLYMLSGLPD
jgi:polar amino acid transport system substrate-binding protein/glutamate/aspartate transport system substrate-binding protein